MTAPFFITKKESHSHLIFRMVDPLYMYSTKPEILISHYDFGMGCEWPPFLLHEAQGVTTQNETKRWNRRPWYWLNYLSPTMTSVLPPHMGKGGGRGDAPPPWRSKTSPLPCTRKMSTHHMKKAHTLFYTPFCWAEKLHFLHSSDHLFIFDSWEVVPFP